MRGQVGLLVASDERAGPFPVDTSQRPMLALLGAREADKRLIQWTGGHGDLAPNYAMLIREALTWFDRYLGTVK